LLTVSVLKNQNLTYKYYLQWYVMSVRYAGFYFACHFQECSKNLSTLSTVQLKIFCLFSI